MSYSSVSYSANSAANSGKDYTYPFPAVTHDTDNILVLVGGTSLAITRYTVASSGGTITLEAAPGAGTAPLDVALSASNVLKVYRFTNRTSPEVVFSSTAIIQDEDLNNATDQVRYLALEAVDRANEGMTIDESDASRYNVQIDGVDKRIFGIATPTNDKDAVNKAYADANVSLAAGSATAAAGSATTAAADAVSTAADAVSTAADVVLAEADKVQTGLDRVAVAADLVATNQDTIDTAADVVLAEADKVQTGLDRVATAADKVATNADVVLTAADEVLTRADTVLTAADVVSSAASAAAAAASFDSFDDRYLGAKSTDPTVDNDGATLLDGTLYFNTTANNMRVYDLGGTTWNVLDALPQGLATTDSPTFNVIKLTGGSPGADKVLTSDADGDATWEVNASPPILTSLDYPGDDTALDTVGEFNLNCTTQTTTTVLAASTTGIAVGHVVKGVGIPTSPVPTVVSIVTDVSFVLSAAATASSGTAISLTFNTQTLVITGSNFSATITSVLIDGTAPSTVTRDSSTQITVTGTPPKAAGTYAGSGGLVVTNSTGLSENINVDYSPLPGWTSPVSGNLLDAFNGLITEIALTGGVDTTSYVITTGTLPTGLTIGSDDGDINGTMNASAATYNFTVDAIDAQAQSSPRLFNIISKGALPTGGTIIEAGAYTGGGYRSHTFFFAGNGTATNIFTPSSSFNVDYLVVAGGGGGGAHHAGGGGAGGFLTAPSLAVTAQDYTITVGAGGIAVSATTGGVRGLPGDPSSIVGADAVVNIVSTGGGEGGASGTTTFRTGGAGGSGGGAGGDGGTAAGSITKGVRTASPVQGNDGGYHTSGSSPYQPASGGGAGAVGGNTGDAGGAGLANYYRDGNSLSGTTAGIHIFAGGGGGSPTTQGGADLAGGSGGGGSGGDPGVAGAPNSGSGGGGGDTNSTSGAGGSGIVVIRYAYP